MLTNAEVARMVILGLGERGCKCCVYIKLIIDGRCDAVML
jgi:hypothetical protein